MLQYTVYAVMIPFFDKGGDQIAYSWLGEPGPGDTNRFRGDDGTAKKQTNIRIDPVVGHAWNMLHILHNRFQCRISMHCMCEGRRLNELK